MTGSSLLFKNAMVHDGVTRRSADALSEVTLMGMSAAVTRLIAAGFFFLVDACDGTV